jgi:hypothetical protein
MTSPTTWLLLGASLTCGMAGSCAAEGLVQDKKKRQRVVKPVGGGAREHEISADVEAATRRGLAYLARNQSKDGFWTGDVGFKVNASYRITHENSAHPGITGLALMAFLACGEVPGKGRYGAAVDRAVDYLLRCTEENGFIWNNGTRMYSHAFATLALAEVYGMSTRKDVRTALERSVNLIADSQNSEGGWRYKPFAQESDMSITVCQVMALRAARNSGIHVPRNVIDDAVKYVRLSARALGEQSHWRRFRSRRYGLFNTGVFKYQMRPDARASFALTAAGVTTLYGAGIYQDPLLERGLNFMSAHFQEYNDNFQQHYFFYYGNYYAVQAFYIAGGNRWAHYRRKITAFLLSGQSSEGSWTCPTGPGKNFATSVSVLILGIPFQYLPIFQR